MSWYEPFFKGISKTAERHPHAGVFISLSMLGGVVVATTHAAWAAVSVSLGLGGLYTLVVMITQRHAASLEERRANNEAKARAARRNVVAGKLEQATLPFDEVRPKNQSDPQ